MRGKYMFFVLILILLALLMPFFIPAKFIKHKIIKKIFAFLYFFFSDLIAFLLYFFVDTNPPCERFILFSYFCIANTILMFIYHYPLTSIKNSKYWHFRLWIFWTFYSLYLLSSYYIGFGWLHECMNIPENTPYMLN